MDFDIAVTTLQCGLLTSRRPPYINSFNGHYFIIWTNASAKLNTVVQDRPLSVVVTGATSGIGQAIARGFAQSGEQVLALGVGDLPPPEPNLSYAELDVQDRAAVVAAISPHEALRVIVNCAGIIRRDA